MYATRCVYTSVHPIKAFLFCKIMNLLTSLSCRYVRAHVYRCGVISIYVSMTSRRVYSAMSFVICSFIVTGRVCGV